MARGSDTINGLSEASRADVPADVLVDCVCLVVRGVPGGPQGSAEEPSIRRASWACTQLDERGALSRLTSEMPGVASAAA